MGHIDVLVYIVVTQSAVYPPQTLTEDELATLEDDTIKLAKGLNIIGLINIQFVIAHDGVYVLEVNPRLSRNVRFLKKNY